MAQPIATASGIAFAFPDVCNTPTPGGPVPIPYPNIAQLADASPVAGTAGNPVTAGGTAVLLANSVVQTSSGDEAGTAGGGISSGTIKGACEMTTFSSTVFANGQGVVRFGDTTSQNTRNAVGTVLSAFPTVLVGG
ncbi:DUF4150 domain-containing protein [Fluviibacterium sp. DFM31]|uniref:DUF4150 domain-containing protein n=1 Tax=Meridianimarinicoccus marinus TaxID=3231483 RepID=A0ABV3L7H6_9RHOB